MNIGSGIENLTQIFSSQATSATNASKTGTTSENQAAANTIDKARLSETGTKASQSSADSDIRLDKVASIQSALAAGTYSVPASAVAHKLVDSILTPEKQ